MARLSMQRQDGYLPISGYGLIGNCHTAALVGVDGSIDWYCPDEFDAPALFCRILDDTKGGFLSIAPTGDYDVERQYIDGTAILQTTFRAGECAVRVTDLMPIAPQERTDRGQDVHASGDLLRLVEGLAGSGDLEIRFKAAFDYAETPASYSTWKDGVVARGGKLCATLSCPGVELTQDSDGCMSGRLQVSQGDRRWVALSHSDPGNGSDPPHPDDCERLLQQTCDYWSQWSGACTYHGPHRDEVVRSAITLKLLTFEPTGAIIAAPTTSLPENIGGVRNWDYRYTWLRDSALILYALMGVGYQEEATDFLRWLHRTIGSDPTATPQIMYTIHGDRTIPERELKHLEGYRRSRPVRIGNGAATQTQLDIYGEVLMAAGVHFGKHTPTAAGDESRPPQEQTTFLHDMWPVLCYLVEKAAKDWREHGEGIWEVRGGPRDFLYGKLLCWSALNSGIHLAEQHHLQAPLQRWRGMREEIRKTILEKGYDERCGYFTQAFGDDSLDATALMIPRIGFLPATDPRVQSTVRHVQQDLTRNGLVYRYRSKDGLAGGEGTFTLCTFWLIDALALGGHVDEAHEMFEKAAGYANDLGLLSEELSPDNGMSLGNFPQGFSHLALIQSALNLAKISKHGAEEHPETMGQRAGRASQAAAQGH